MVKVGPTISVFVPLDVLSFESAGAFLGVKIVDVLDVRKGLFKLVWVDSFLGIEITPPMSGSWRVDCLVDPKSKEVSFSFDLRAKVVVELCVDELLFCRVERIMGWIGFFTPFPPFVHTRVTV
jgi:hypothetical protein